MFRFLLSVAVSLIGLINYSLQAKQHSYIHTVPARYPPKKDDDLEYVFNVSIAFQV